MAIFRKGVKLGKGGMNDVRVSLISKSRAKGLLRKAKIIDDGRGRKQFETDARGEVNVYRKAVAQAEGFQFPVRFKVSFQPPQGISHPTYNGTEPANPQPEHPARGPRQTANWSQASPNGYVRGGGLDWKTHKMNYSAKTGDGSIRQKYNEAADVAFSLWNPDLENTKMKSSGPDPYAKKTEQRVGRDRQETILNLFCNKVSIPEKSINFASMRHYGTHFAYPQSVSYGSMTTTFYCDGEMKIKNFFDAWQKLIYNDLTGNFNYYDEYISEFDIFTRGVIATNSGHGRAKGKKDKPGMADKISGVIKEGTAAVNDWTGVENPRSASQATKPRPTLRFMNTYGVKIMQCWPQIVSSIDLGHASTNAPAEFSVTWAYKKWNTFNMGDIGKRGQVNLAVGEFKNEKDGFPFLEDLPNELAGPLSGAVNQGINTSSLSKASNLFG